MRNRDAVAKRIKTRPRRALDWATTAGPFWPRVRAEYVPSADPHPGGLPGVTLVRTSVRMEPDGGHATLSRVQGLP